VRLDFERINVGITLVCTILIAAFTAVMTKVSLNQQAQTNRSLELAEAAMKATRRPWLVVMPGDGKGPRANDCDTCDPDLAPQLSWAINIRNDGSGSAINVIHTVRYSVTRGPGLRVFAVGGEYPEIMSPHDPIRAGESSYWSTGLPKAVTPDEWDAYAGGTGDYYLNVQAVVLYSDEFGDRHHTTLCRSYRGDTYESCRAPDSNEMK